MKFKEFSLFFFIGLLTPKTYGQPLCSDILNAPAILNISWTPYNNNKVETPRTLRDPYLQYAFSSDAFREFLLSSFNNDGALVDYKSFVDAIPKSREPAWLNENKKPREMSFLELLNYITKNYDLDARADLNAVLTYRDGPLSNPLANQIWAGLDRAENTYLPTHVLKILNSIHRGWSDLLRKTPEAKSDQTTLLFLPNPYIVAGGRFKETYFWDSYWIMKGLIESGYREVALGILENFIYMIENYGLIANGNRYYYLTRTQVPIVTEMVKLFEKERLLNFSEEAQNSSLEMRILTALDLYYANVWKSTERYNLDYGLFRYSDGAGGELRPESLFIRPEASAREPRSSEFHSQRVFAESGWDMSYTRFGERPQDWFPTDLNALMISYTESMSKWFKIVGRPLRAKYFGDESTRIKEQYDRHLFDPDLKVYLDYNYKDKRRSSVVTAASYFSFWLFDPTDKQHETNETLHALLRLTGILKPEGSFGIHSTSKQGDGQWDGSWTWANLNEVAFQALKRHGLDTSANKLAMDYSFMVGRAFFEEGEELFYEKYNAETGSIRLPEETEIYGNEVGFGWTNATMAVFLRHLYNEGLLHELNERLKGE